MHPSKKSIGLEFTGGNSFRSVDHANPPFGGPSSYLMELALLIGLAALALLIEGGSTIGRIALGVAVFSLVGFSFAGLFSLFTPRVFAVAWLACLGQAICFVYFLTRVSLANASLLPSFSATEWKATLVLFVAAGWLSQRRVLRHSFDIRVFATSAIAILIWSAMYLWRSRLELSLWGPLGSDGDLHIVHARVLSEIGKFFYTFPGSDASMEYPLGFATLNWLWMQTTGMTAPVAVLLQPSLQVLLLMGSALAIWFHLMAPTKRLGIAGLFAVWILGWVWFDPINNSSLNGTARISYTSLLLVPVLLSATGDLRRSGMAFLLAALCALVAVLFNPCLLPSSFVLFSIAVYLSRDLFARMRWGKSLALILAVAAIGILWMSADPFLRGFVYSGHVFGKNEIQSSEVPSQRGNGVTANGTALDAPLVDLSKSSTVAHRILWSTFLPFNDRFCTLWLIALGVLALLPCLQVQRAACLQGFFRTLLLFVFFHGAVAAIVVKFANPSSLFGALLENYISDAHFRTLLCLSLLCLPAVLYFRPRQKWQQYIALGLAVATLESFYQYANVAWLVPKNDFLLVNAEDVQMANWMQQNIPGDRRILLEGKVLSNSHQSTVHPQGGSRAVALYTSLPTAFFYGMDGRAFNSANYIAHVTQWDGEWMRQNQIGYFYHDARVQDFSPPPHAELVHSIGGASLYKLAP
jgi:hypothetical protein